MTVCIAALADNGTSIVTASDRMYSWGGETSGDGRIKTQRIHKRYWSVMLAGDDVRRLEPVIAYAQDGLRLEERPTLEQVKTVLENAWVETVRDIQERTVLSLYGYDRPTFFATGRAQLGEVKFNDVLYELQAAGDLGCELLVYGFDEWNHAKLLAISGRGGVTDCSRIGFWAIGSGARPATDALFFVKYQQRSRTRRAIYMVAHAKFMSERALGVGKSTLVVALRNDGSAALFEGNQIKAIRDYWGEHTRPVVRGVDELIVPEPAWEPAIPVEQESLTYATPSPAPPDEDVE